MTTDGAAFSVQCCRKIQFAGQQELTATTWKKEGAPDTAVSINVDLATAFDKSKPD